MYVVKETNSLEGHFTLFLLILRREKEMAVEGAQQAFSLVVSYTGDGV